MIHQLTLKLIPKIPTNEYKGAFVKDHLKLLKKDSLGSKLDLHHFFKFLHKRMMATYHCKQIMAKGKNDPTWSSTCNSIKN